MTLSELIMKGAKDKDWSLMKLAREIGITHASLYKWTNRDPARRAPVPWRHWARLCQVLEIPLPVWLRVARQEWPEGYAAYERFLAKSRSAKVRPVGWLDLLPDHLSQGFLMLHAAYPKMPVEGMIETALTDYLAAAKAGLDANGRPVRKR